MRILKWDISYNKLLDLIGWWHTALIVKYKFRIRLANGHKKNTGKWYTTSPFYRGEWLHVGGTYYALCRCARTQAHGTTTSYYMASNILLYGQ